MFGFSMIQTVRRHGKKLDRSLRNELVELYRPMRWIPCFLHSTLEKMLKKTRKISVIIQFEDDDECYISGIKDVNHITVGHLRCQLKHEYPSISGCCADLTPEAIEELLANCPHVKKIHRDREVKALLDVAVPSIYADSGSLSVQDGADAEPRILTGEGVTIAVIDTGIYRHPDIKDRIKAFVDLTANSTGPYDTDPLKAYDDNGHGTHVAGCAAGDGTASSNPNAPAGRVYRGPAPRADVIGLKVLNKMGSGSLSTVIAGVQWCIDHKEQYGIHIISMSLGGPAADPGEPDPVVDIVEKAWAQGMVVCVAAGNEGNDGEGDAGTIASPGVSPLVITVGAMDDQDTFPPREDDRVAGFSSRGPTPSGEVKPDLLSPGVGIISLRSPNSYLDKLQKSNRVGNDYFVLSGTSMATPICSGVAALLLQYNPALTPGEVKAFLKQGATAWGEAGPGTSRDSNTYGAGYINAKASVALANKPK